MKLARYIELELKSIQRQLVLSHILSSDEKDGVWNFMYRHDFDNAENYDTHIPQSSDVSKIKKNKLVRLLDTGEYPGKKKIDIMDDIVWKVKERTPLYFEKEEEGKKVKVEKGWRYLVLEGSFDNKKITLKIKKNVAYKSEYDAKDGGIEVWIGGDFKYPGQIRSIGSFRDALESILDPSSKNETASLVNDALKHLSTKHQEILEAISVDLKPAKLYWSHKPSIDSGYIDFTVKIDWLDMPEHEVADKTEKVKKDFKEIEKKIINLMDPRHEHMFRVSGNIKNKYIHFTFKPLPPLPVEEAKPSEEDMIPEVPKAAKVIEDFNSRISFFMQHSGMFDNFSQRTRTFLENCPVEWEAAETSGEAEVDWGDGTDWSTAELKGKIKELPLEMKIKKTRDRNSYYIKYDNKSYTIGNLNDLKELFEDLASGDTPNAKTMQQIYNTLHLNKSKVLAYCQKNILFPVSEGTWYIKVSKDVTRIYVKFSKEVTDIADKKNVYTKLISKNNYAMDGIGSYLKSFIKTNLKMEELTLRMTYRLTDHEKEGYAGFVLTIRQ